MTFPTKNPSKLLTRDDYRNGVFARDRHVDTHHIIENRVRKEAP
jgi:hypothetical protein